MSRIKALRTLDRYRALVEELREAQTYYYPTKELLKEINELDTEILHALTQYYIKEDKNDS